MIARPTSVERAARATVLLRHMENLPAVQCGNPDAMQVRAKRIDLLIDLLNGVDNPPDVQRRDGVTVLRMMGLGAASKGGLEQALRNWCHKARRAAGIERAA
ncbi:hypothetical protein ACVDG3_18125 [Meridianimarinicoccus sp. RP-17]|uniref:hypothetical protein n=1 Tax=Meridianimarinicoccus zhengii TaxID=2056810 RepID=UPI000DAE2CA6|nr:hypothetical protein [Phycocomes zhengii]